MNIVRYTVKTLRSGQPRAYADTEREYLVTVEASFPYGADKDVLKPWLQGGDVEAGIRKDEAARKAGNMIGGTSPDDVRKNQREWAKRVLKGLVGNFREPNDSDGMEGATAYFYPTLKKLTMNADTGEIRALIVEAYTD